VASIDGVLIRDCYADVSKWISAASEGWRRVRFANILAWEYPERNPAQFVLVKPNGRKLRIELERTLVYTPITVTAKSPGNAAQLAPGIVYFDLIGTPAAVLTQSMPKLVAAKGIVFDLRGVPGEAAKEIVRHLIDKSVETIRMSIPVVRRPDREDLQWEEITRWELQPAEPRLKAKIAFLTDARAIGASETIMGIIENYELGEIVGSTTAGTNGNVNYFSLPGRYTVYWTGMRVLKHDGSQHHGVGIKPTVPVTPTAKGIAAGRDEVLAKAVEVLKAKIAAGAKPGA